MNYLAHAYLSMEKPGIITGNMISDFVKGKRQFDLPSPVFKGLKLHRAIDGFTDKHESTAFIKNIFRPRYRLYAGAFADVAYDHFVANDKNLFEHQHKKEALLVSTCDDLESNRIWLPEKFIPVLQSMKTYKWLILFGEDPAMKKSFEGLVRRSAYLHEAEFAFELFMTRKQEMKAAYDNFIPELIRFSRNVLEELMEKD
jgi:acyl carrier protein phosphodiesterase